jgi:hypothetical protein
MSRFYVDIADAMTRNMVVVEQWNDASGKHRSRIVCKFKSRDRAYAKCAELNAAA